MTIPPPRSAATFISSCDSVPLLLFFAAAISLLKHPPPPPPPPTPPRPPPPLSRRSRLSLPMQPTTKPPEPLVFSSPDSLASWLLPRVPPSSLDSWGVSPGSKTLHNLFLELSLGESSLLPQSAPSPPLRCVQVATVKIRNSRGSILVESHQLLSDGTIRTRGRPLSEKMLPGESVEEAAARAVREEIGRVGVRIRPGSYEVRVEERLSASYPGLPAKYVLHSVEAEVDGLPEEGEFSTEETGECDAVDGVAGKTVTVRRHFWKWVDDVDGLRSSGA